MSTNPWYIAAWAVWATLVVYGGDAWKKHRRRRKLAALKARIDAADKEALDGH